MKRIKSTMTGWTKNGRSSYIHESKVEIKKVNGFWEIFGGAEDGYRYETLWAATYAAVKTPAVWA
jgi:hypothetical protein